ncbi:MAG: isopentenyl-diphosphate delta-isomerase [Myxococcales bacterium]
MAGDTPTGSRKDHHLRICLEEDVGFAGVRNGFERYRFDHDALPEVDLAAVTTETRAFGKALSMPLMIGAMTGGTAKAGEVNRILAAAAQQTGIGFALGSQRRMLEEDDAFESYDIRQIAPDVLLMGNIGAVQLNCGVTPEMVSRLVRRTGCDVMAFHLNPLQEAIQPEGDTNFAGLCHKIEEAAAALPVPVVLKEVGAGISAVTAQKIRRLPVGGVEVAGVGGTSWSRIEALRSSNRIQADTGEELASWGIPTAESLVTCRRMLPDLPIICSGGMRTGLEIAKALALGADLCAMALPFLQAAQGGVDAVVERIEQIRYELRTVMFLTGAATVEGLRTRAVLRRI